MNAILGKGAGVATTPVSGTDDVRRFFDRCALEYSEQHGDAEHLLAYRLGLIRKHAYLQPADVVLDVGCGPGHHLFALSADIRRGIGIDLSPRMIASAAARAQALPEKQRLRFVVDDATALATVADASADLALCIGTLEHVLDKPAALASIHRVLRPGGRLFCLTPDGNYLWYRRIAPALRLRTKHLSTDSFLDRSSLVRLLERAGYARIETGAWTFIPKGDMPPSAATLLAALDVVGRMSGLRNLRGGLWACAWRGGSPTE